MKFELSTFKTVASCSLLMLTHLTFSGQTTFTINSETIKTIPPNNSFIYPVEYREIEYYPYVEGKVETNFYKSFLDDKKELEKTYNEHTTRINNRVSKKDQIIKLLTAYLNGSENKALLDEADNIAKDLKIKYNFSKIGYITYDGKNRSSNNLFIKDENGKYAGKKILQEYITFLNSDNNFQKQSLKSYDDEQYLKLLEEDKKMADSDKYEIGRIKSENLAKRKAYLVLKNQEIKDFSMLYGKYKEISSTMLIANTAIEDRFIENELSENFRKYRRYDGENQYTLMENTVTGKFYVIPYNIYSNIMNVNSDEIAVKELIAMGYNIDDSNGYKFINTKHYKIEATNALKKRLEKEKDYLQKLDVWYEQRQSIRKQIIAMIPKFDHYVRLYRLQRNRMTQADISAWTTLTKSANSLNKKQVDLNDKLWGWTDIHNSDKKYHEHSGEFINYLSASTGVLGL